MISDHEEQYVIQLYEGKTFKEIAQLIHMSFRDIGAIVKRYKEEIEGQNGQLRDHDTEPKSKESKAFKLFSEGKSPIEVVVALDLPSDEARAIYREYWELQGMYELAKIYKEAKYVC
jgi:transposase